MMRSQLLRTISTLLLFALAMSGMARPAYGHGGVGAHPDDDTATTQAVVQFLTLPFNPHPDMKIVQGWFYNFNFNGQPCPPSTNQRLHCGIDYIKKPGASAYPHTEWQHFDVVAAADGTARRGGCPTCSGGNYVTVTHTINGRTYTTYYGHLESVVSKVAAAGSAGVAVARGEMIGVAGDSGSGGLIHLHFYLKDGSLVDPYDLYTEQNGPLTAYPDPNGANGVQSGPDHYWTTNPPSYAGEAPVDTTPPTATPTVSGPSGASGWYTGPVSVTWQLADAESGIASSSGCDTATLAADTGGTSIACTATNGAGIAVTQAVSVKIDQTAPELSGTRTPAANPAGWNATDVTVSFTCTDATSGVAAPPASPQTLSAEGAGQSASGTCVDAAGNSASATVDNINIDKTAPSIVIASPRERDYTRLDTLGLSWQVSDALSGVERERGALDGALAASGQSVDLFFLRRGAHSLAVKAADRAGNVTQVSVTFNLVVTLKSLAATNQRACDLGLIGKRGICNSLQAKLTAALRAQERGQDRQVHQKLASYLSQLQAQRGKSVAPSAYDLLSGDAQYLLDRLAAR